MNHLFKKFRRDIAGLMWAALGIFIGLALFSYSPTDPSLNSIGKSSVAHNFCGYFGSFLADLAYQLFGLSAWVLVLGSLKVSYAHFRAREVAVTRWRLVVGALLMITLASLGALYFPQMRWFSDQVALGGEVGRLVSRGLIRIFNEGGVAVILWTAVAMLLVFYTERPVAELLRRPWQMLSRGPRRAWATMMVGGERFMNVWRSWLIAPATPVINAEEIVGIRAKQFRAAVEEAPERRFFPLSKDKAAVQAGAQDEIEEAETREPEITHTRRKVRLSMKIARRVENWELPKLSLLEDPPATRTRLDEREIKNKAKLLVEKLAQFDIQGEVVGIKPGPAVTMFEFKPAADVKISRITDLADDLSLALSSESVRIVAPIPGRDVVGIETSNTQREGVYLKDIVAQNDFWQEDCKLPLALGRRANGEPKIVDLRKMPHLLVAGTTGSGKSVFVVSVLTGLLFRHSPKTLKLILVDPKQVDLAAFNEVPHLVMPPIREARKAVGALRWAIREMEKRYRSMSKFGARGLEAFNEMVGNLSADEIKEHETYNQPTDGPAKQDTYYFAPQPYIVIVVEEFGDLMAVDKANVEQAVVRLAQMARACGIHLILAMQSPRRDVVTGLIKTNIPGRISFKVASKMDSRIILDEGGAERLLARGDMLFLAPGVAKPDRHHGPFLSEPEIAAVVKSWRSQGEPEYDPLALRSVDGNPMGEMGDIGAGEMSFDDDDIKDERYDEILAHVATLKDVSASLLQRKFRLGYPRAARMIEIFEAEGVIGPANGSKPRQVLIKEHK
ncbi:MAG: DNA translocase FtsK [Bdellovibrionales bacterium]